MVSYRGMTRTNYTTTRYIELDTESPIAENHPRPPSNSSPITRFVSIGGNVAMAALVATSLIGCFSDPAEFLSLDYSPLRHMQKIGRDILFFVPTGFQYGDFLMNNASIATMVEPSILLWPALFLRKLGIR
jgi:hypothetical protein